MFRHLDVGIANSFASTGPVEAINRANDEIKFIQAHHGEMTVRDKRRSLATALFGSALARGVIGSLSGSILDAD
jgi:hypothetical protein